RQQDFFVHVNNGPFLAAGTTSDTTLSDGSGPGQNEINWALNTTVTSGDHLDIIYLRHPGFIQSFIGFAETITYVPAGSPLITSQPTNLELLPGGSGNLTVA